MIRCQDLFKINRLLQKVGSYQSTITSQTLEQDYIANPDGQISFTTSGHKYILDFGKMTQQNLKHKTEREVRRRPKFVSVEDVEERKKM